MTANGIYKEMLTYANAQVQFMCQILITFYIMLMLWHRD